MTDNKPPPKEDNRSTPSPRRRIAPTNISAVTQSSRLRSSIPYPFQPNIEEDRQDAADDDEKDQFEDFNEDARPREDRELLRLAHSFFERRSDDEGSTELRRANAVNTPNPHYTSLIPPGIRSNRYFNLVRVLEADTFDPEIRQYTELYELQWSAEHIKPISLNELRLKFLQEYPGLLDAATDTLQLPVESTPNQNRIFIRVAPNDMRGIAGIVFPIIGLITCFVKQSSANLHE
jgi:hypothetical protein